MKKTLAITMFMLAMLAWAAAQQSPTTQDPSSGQTASPSSQAPGGAGQSQPSTPAPDQPASKGQAANTPITQGCLGGSAPNYTITDNAGTTYKLNIPSNADTSKLAPHVGESVQVAGNVNDAGKAGSASIDVQGIGTGTGKCPGNGTKDAQSPPKQ